MISISRTKTYESQKNLKNRFEAIKIKSKKNCYSDQIQKYKNYIKKNKKTWKIMKEIVGKR